MTPTAAPCWGSPSWTATWRCGGRLRAGGPGPHGQRQARVTHLRAAAHAARPPRAQAIAEVCTLCSDARVELRSGHHRAVGQPTEAALLVLVEKLGLADAAEQQAVQQARRADPEHNVTGACAAYTARYRRLATLEFDRDRKSMSVLLAPAGGAAPMPAVGATPVRRSSRLASILGGGGAGGGGNVLLVKGAAECVLQRCSRAMLADGSVVPLDAGSRTQLQGLLDGLAGRALRLLAFAVKSEGLGELADYDGSEGHRGHVRLADPGAYEGIESDLTFLGLAGLQDPPRPEVGGGWGGSDAGEAVSGHARANRFSSDGSCVSWIYDTTLD